MISDIRLQQFRSYTDASFEFTPLVNIIVGPNASGKTNLLEALLAAAKGSSYRVRDQELVMFGRDWARLDVHTGENTRTLKLVGSPEVIKTFELDNKVYRRLSLQHTLPVVLFEPNHLLLLHGSPEQRRNYLDDMLAQTTPNYPTLLRHYRRVLAQRNALLKRAKKPSNEELFPWNLRLSELGAQISRKRGELAESLNTELGTTYKDLSKSKIATELNYLSQFPAETYESRLMQKLEENLAVDALRGFTGAGPHREDFGVLFDDRPAGETASRGETRTLLLALKIIELSLLQAARDQAPLLLLDDVFSELDGARRHALTEHLTNYQTFITTTDADIVLKDFSKSATVIPIERKAS